MLGGQTQRQNLSLLLHGVVDVLDVFLVQVVLVQKENVLLAQ